MASGPDGGGRELTGAYLRAARAALRCVTTALDPPSHDAEQAPSGAAASPGGPRHRRPGTARRWWRRARASVPDAEWRVVALMAVAASLSAFSFWQATQFADEDAGLRERARIASTEAARDERELQALVDFDLDLTTTWCAASAERDAALVDLIGAGPDQAMPATDALVTQRLRSAGVWNLLQADGPGTPCAGGDQPGADPYSVDAAREWRVAADPTFGSAGGPVASDARARAAHAERLLMYAAVAFAIALLLQTAAKLASSGDGADDGARRRGRGARIWGGLAWCALGVGAVLVVGEAPLGATAAWLVATLAALALAFLAVTLVGRRRGSGRAGAHRIRWWAELVGGITLVGLALAALELSVVAGRQRAARAEADRLSVVAERMVEAGEQSALHDLAAAAELDELDAREAAANQVAEASDQADRVEGARASAEAHAAAVERLPSTGDGPAGSAAVMCPVAARPDGVSYDGLLAASRTDPSAFAAHVAARREDGAACTVQAALSRSEADAWADRAATVTVALVAMGLGGFLLALASDSERSPAPARWLLSLGAVGVTAGGLLALSVVTGAGLGGGPGRHDRLAFARHVAAGETALDSGDCDSALTALDEALSIHDGHAPAYEARATARLCTADDDWLISPPVPAPRVAGALADRIRAADLGTPRASDLGDITWLRAFLTLGDAHPAEAELARAADAAAEAVDAATASGSPGTHVARFNRALLLLAVGEGAAGPAYEEALRCLDPAASCPGGGIGAGELRALYRLMALDDLELLGDRVPSAEVDRYRQLIVAGAGLEGRPAVAADPAWSVTVFPQELGVWSADESDPSVSVVWYHRAGPADPWDVVIDPSIGTVEAGRHGNLLLPTSRPLPAGSYRADVYVDGRIARAEAGFEGTGSDERVVVPDLGVSAVVPAGWDLDVRTAGVETAVGPSDAPDALVFRRVEGTWPDADMDLGEWLDATLDEWVADQVGADATDGAQPVAEGEDSYVVGLPDERERWYPEAGVRAGIGLWSYAGDPYCGGALFMTLIRDDGTDVPARVWGSMVLDWAAIDRVAARAGHVAMDGWSMDLPAGWVGVEDAQSGTGGLLAAQECLSGASLVVDAEEVVADEVAGPDALDAVVDTRVWDLMAGVEGLARERTEATVLAGGEPAVDVTLVTAIDGFEIEHRQLYALDGTTLYTVTATVPGDSDYDEVVDGAFDSFALT
jgi:hypothetical protein